ncbi:MAG: hypothetical protein P8Y18_10605 [Candidatus Bathyarchaeota archaeon]
MNIKKHIIILFILILALPIIIISLNSTFAQTNLEQKIKSETLLTILQNDNKTVKSTIDKLERNNITVPKNALTTYNEATILAKEANNFLNQEKYIEANNEALKSMQKFEETLRLLDNILQIESTETEKIAEKIILIKANITRISDYLIRLENLTEKAKVLEYNTTEIEKQLTTLKQYLDTAKQKLNSINLEEATKELELVTSLQARLEEYFIKLTNRISTSNIDKYLQDAETRVTSAKINITDSATLTQEIKREAITALDNSETNLENARNYNEDNNLKEAINELEEAKKWEEESNRIISSVSTTSTSVSAINENILLPEKTNLTSK